MRSDTPFNAWDASASPERRIRDKAAFKRKIRELHGHWLWCGKFNFADTPVHLVNGEFVSASDVIYELWRGKFKPLGAVRQCDWAGCVNPKCYRQKKAGRK